MLVWELVLAADILLEKMAACTVILSHIWVRMV